MDAPKKDGNTAFWTTARCPGHGARGWRGRAEPAPRKTSLGLLVCYPIARALMLRRRRGGTER